MNTFTVDQSHSEIGFKVRHLGISSVKGAFKNYDVEIIGDSIDKLQVKFSAKVSSINTSNIDRDAHLASGDFFNSDEYPTIDFVSNVFDTNDGNLVGDLTIKGVTHPITLTMEYYGSQKDPWGNSKHGFKLQGKINRTDYGLAYNSVMETGGLLIGEHVRFNIELELLETSPQMAEA